MPAALLRRAPATVFELAVVRLGVGLDTGLAAVFFFEVVGV